MKKISKDVLRGMRPLPKQLEFKGLDEQDNEMSITFNILPFTVDEKAEIELIRQDLEKLDTKSQEYITATTKMSTRAMYFILRKTVDDLTEEDIPLLVQTEWQEDIYWKAMEFEGITPEVRKKIMDGELTL